ncbi:MAG: inositol monophosphatase family protein [Ilumatobacteraceae bacterium]
MRLDLDELCKLAASLAREAGKMVRDGRTHGINHTSTKSTDTDMVTEFDKASERLIVQRLVRLRPDDAIVGEEGTDTEGRSGVRWLIDPIDGTTNFLYGLPGYNVSIAARTEEGTQVGAVYVPSMDELFTAIRGGGAKLDGTPIRCSTTTSLRHALVATGFSYLPERRESQAARVTQMIGKVRDIRRSGAAAYDLCCAAAGRVDAYFEQWLGPWDLAAGELIAVEAGCRTGSFDGGPVEPSNVLVAAPALFEPMIALLRESGN